ncbi:hypothetical protein SALBM135S_05383 [Streptomyces alboniger]
MPLPPEGAAPQPLPDPYAAQGGHAAQQQGYGTHDPYAAHDPYPAQGGHAAPGQGGHPVQPGQSQGGGRHGRGAHAAPSAQGAHAARQGHGAHAAPPAQGAHAAPGQGDASYGGPQGYGGQSMPLPPAVTGPDADATQYIAPIPGGGPLPGGHIPGAPASGGQAPAVDEGATQYLPPVSPGALPPEAPAADATQFLGRARPAAPAPSDSEPTQYIAPVPGNSGPAGHGAPAEPAAAPYGIRPGAPGDRQPPAEFDSLFRTEPEAEGPASTQQMPRFDASAPAAPAAHAPAPMPARGDGGRGGRRSRTGSKVPSSRRSVSASPCSASARARS